MMAAQQEEDEYGLDEDFSDDEFEHGTAEGQGLEIDGHDIKDNEVFLKYILERENFHRQQQE